MTLGVKIAAAIVAFQKDMPTVLKEKTATVPTKSGGQYSYTYADLADVMENAAPVLTQHGLAFISHPEFSEGRPMLVGVLLHESGETVEGTLPLTGTTDQAMGSSLTYARRYLLGCLTGIVTDNDDDGAHASRPAGTRKKAAEAKAEAEPTPTRRMSRPQQDKTPRQKAEGRMWALFAECGYKSTEKERMLAFISKVCDHAVQSRTDITDEELSAVITELEVQKGASQ
jgi:hypothetical protein